jgi:hypothetical protein
MVFLWQFSYPLPGIFTLSSAPTRWFVANHNRVQTPHLAAGHGQGLRRQALRRDHRLHGVKPAHSKPCAFTFQIANQTVPVTALLIERDLSASAVDIYVTTGLLSFRLTASSRE